MRPKKQRRKKINRASVNYGTMTKGLTYMLSEKKKNSMVLRKYLKKTVAVQIQG